jgi:transposase
LIDDDHTARIVWAFVEGLDLSELYARIKSVEGGAGSPAIDPKILIALWLYAILDHEIRARRIARLCRESSAYIWLCGGVNVNHHTLSDFYSSGKDWLEEQIAAHLACLQTQGLVDFTRTAQDGMRVRASAGASSFRRQESLEENLVAAREHIEKLRQEQIENPVEGDKRKRAAQERAAREKVERLEAALEQLPEVEAKKKDEEARKKARVSTTDPDARVMKMADGGYRPAFNVQFSTDPHSQVITGYDVVNVTDQNQLSPMLEQIHERTGEYPAECVVDGGFANHKEIEAWAEKGVVVYTPVPKPKDAERDPHKPLPKDSPPIAAWRERMGTDEAKEIYKERASTAECVNAITRLRGLQQFTVRGLTKVKTSIMWFVLAHNLMREANLRPAVA